MPWDHSSLAFLVTGITEEVNNLPSKKLVHEWLDSLLGPGHPRGRPSIHRNPELIEIQELIAPE